MSEANEYCSIYLGTDEEISDEHYVSTVGCSCCSDSNEITKAEYIKLLKNLKELIEKKLAIIEGKKDE